MGRTPGSLPAVQGLVTTAQKAAWGAGGSGPVQGLGGLCGGFVPSLRPTQPQPTW